MAKNLTIKQFKELKRDLEDKIASLFQDFEATTGSKILYVDILRKDNKGGPLKVPIPDETDTRKIAAVRLNLGLDFT